MKTIKMHYSPNKYIKLIKLKNKSFCVYIEVHEEKKQHFFNKYEEKEAKEFFNEITK